jgi:hypothetical protein
MKSIMTSTDRSHPISIELIEPPPTEVAPGTAVTLKFRAWCPCGCNLTGMTIKVAAPDRELEGTFAAESDLEGFNEIELETPPRTGEHIWSLTCGPHEVADIRHDAPPLSIKTNVTAPSTSIAVWAISSPVVAGSRFAIEIGAKSSAGIALTAEYAEVRDECGAVVARGCLGKTPYPGTTALYWTTVELVAPTEEGPCTWCVAFEPKELDIPHKCASSTFSFSVVRPPEHRLTVKVIDQDTSLPIADVQVRLGAYRAVTDQEGLAQVEMSEGIYDLDIWKVGHLAPTRPVRLNKSMLIEVEVLSVPEEDPDAAWLM